MALLSDSCVKVTYDIYSRQITSYSQFARPGGAPVGNECASKPKQTFSQTVEPYSDAVKMVGSACCMYGGCKAYDDGITYTIMTRSTASVEYDFASAMTNLRSLYNPTQCSILTIEYPGAFDTLMSDNSLMLHYGNPSSLPNVSYVKGEGSNITISNQPIAMKDYMTRMMNDMYNGKLSSTSIFANQGGNSCQGCPNQFNWCCPSNDYPELFNALCQVPGKLEITFCIVAKSSDLDFTNWDPSGQGHAAPTTDNTTPKPDEETTNHEAPAGSGGLQENYGRSYDKIGGLDGLSNTEVLPPAEFDYVYIPESVDVSSMDGVVVGVGIIAGHVDGAGLTHTNIEIKSITNGIKGSSDSMTFIEHVKYSDAGIFEIGAKVVGLIYGETRFLGWIKAKNRIISDKDQYIQYEATGAKTFLDNLPFSARYNIKNATIAYIFNDIAQYLPKALIAILTNISLLPQSVLPEFEVDSSSFGHALDAIMDYARGYGYYIDYSKELKILDLDSLPVVQLTMPTEGQTLTSSHIIKSKNLTKDISDCRTRCILRGDYPITEYDETRVVSWSSVNTQWIGEIVLNKRIQSNLLSNTSLPVYVYDKASLGTVIPYTVTFVDCNTGIIKILGNTEQLRKNILNVRYCIKDELNPLKYDTGWLGTAYTDYNIQQVLVSQDTRFRQIILPEGIIRDDSSLMPAYASSMLDAIKDWKIGGTIVVDGLNLSLEIGKSVEILSSGCAELAGKYLAIISITWDFESNTTTLNVTNNYYLGTSIIDPIDDAKYDERKLVEQVILSRGKQQDFPWVFNT